MSLKRGDLDWLLVLLCGQLCLGQLLTILVKNTRLGADFFFFFEWFHVNNIYYRLNKSNINIRIFFFMMQITGKINLFVLKNRKIG